MAPHRKLAASQHADWTVWEGKDGMKLLLFRDKIVVPTGFTSIVISEFHDGRGHFGGKRTLDMIRK